MKKYLVLIGCVAVLIIGAVVVIKLLPTAPKSGSYAIQTSGGGAQPVNTLTAATTTPCVVVAPTSATTSIQHFSLNITTGTSSAGTIVIGTSTSPYSTSTSPFATVVVAANSQIVYTWNGGVNNDQVYPGTYIVAGMTNGSAVSYGYTYGGTCSTVLRTD